MPPEIDPPFPIDRLPDYPPPDPSGGMAEAIENAATKFAEAARDLHTAFNSCVEAVAAGAKLFPAVVLAVAQRVLDDLGKLVEAIRQAAEFVVKHHLPVASIIIQRFAWVRNVSDPLSGIGSAMSVNEQPNFTLWTGKAADYYRQRITEQQAAAERVAATAVSIGQWLQDIFQANVQYVEGLATMVVDFVAALGKAAVEAGTGIGLPLAINTLKDQSEMIIKAVGDHLVATGQRFSDTLARTQEIAVMVANKKSLPGGSWPHAVTG